MSELVRLRLGSLFLTWYDRRQRQAAALRCAHGHDMRTIASSHLGSWRHCLRCGLIEDLAS